MSDYIKEKIKEICTYHSELDEGTSGYCLSEEQFQKLFNLFQEMEERTKITEDTSDGYHTFKELYEFRKVYNAVLFNEWTSQGKYNVHKSIRHHDGELCFGGGWFIVVADLPTGQISNHYELKDWDLFQCEEREKAEEWDGHTPQDVVNRLLLLSQKKKDCPKKKLLGKEFIKLAKKVNKDIQREEKIKYSQDAICAEHGRKGCNHWKKYESME